MAKFERKAELISYDEEVGNTGIVIRCECGRYIRVTIPVLLQKPKIKVMEVIRNELE